MSIVATIIFGHFLVSGVEDSFNRRPGQPSRSFRRLSETLVGDRFIGHRRHVIENRRFFADRIDVTNRMRGGNGGGSGH